MLCICCLSNLLINRVYHHMNPNKQEDVKNRDAKRRIAEDFYQLSCPGSISKLLHYFIVAIDYLLIRFCCFKSSGGR